MGVGSAPQMDRGATPCNSPESRVCPALWMMISMEELPHIRSIDDVLSHPQLLAGKAPQEVEASLGNSPGWRVETLGRGAHKGQGWVLREYMPQGHPTGRVIRWHPGIAGLQPGSRSHAGAWRSQDTPQMSTVKALERIRIDDYD